MRSLAAALVVVAAHATPLPGQSQFAAQLTKEGAAFKLQGTEQLTIDADNSFPIREGFVLTIVCLQSNVCDKVTIVDKATNKDLKPKAAADKSSTVLTYGGSDAANPPPVSLRLSVQVSGADVPPELTFVSTSEASIAATKVGGGASNTPLNDLLTAACPDVAFPAETTFVVTALGNVLRRPTKPVNEGTVVVVQVYGPTSLLPQLKASRKSPFRPYRLNNIAGAGETVPVKELTRQGLTEEACATRDFELGDFAPGHGEVEIAAFTNTGFVTTGSFDFTVNDLYTGAFGIGAIRSRVADPSFRSVFNGTDTVVSVSDNDDRVLYVVTYTPFIWGPRDVRVSPRNWWERVNPMVGIVLNSIPDNGLAGVSVDLSNRVYVQAGVHAGRVMKLDPAANLKVGDQFENRGATVPAIRKWEFDWFYGITVDLQAGLSLIKSVLGSGGGT